MLDVGALRHVIEIERAGTTPGSRGMSIAPSSWQTIRTTRAKIETAAGNETAGGGVLVSDVSHVVTARWNGTVVKANDRVVFGGRLFTVKYSENVLERNRVLRMFVREVDGGAQ